MSTGEDADVVEQQHLNAVLARISGARKGLLYDGLADDGTCTTLLASIQEGREFPMRTGRSGQPTSDSPRSAPQPMRLRRIVRGSSDQSNTSIMFDQQLVMKLFRRIEPGPNPDVEITRFLTGRGFTRCRRSWARSTTSTLAKSLPP